MTDPLFVDVYPGDGTKDWAAYCAAGYPWCGAIFKASQGLKYTYGRWLRLQRQAFKTAAGDRYGVDLFDGFYHYLDLAVSGATQAEAFVREVALVGGESVGTLWGMVDVERAGQLVPRITRSLLEDCTSMFAIKYRELTGRKPTLYGGELLRDVGARTLFGCGRSAIALYGPHLPASIIERTGTTLSQLMLWQYRGTEPQLYGPAGYPMVAPGCGHRVDISALVAPGGLEALRAKLWAEHPA